MLLDEAKALQLAVEIANAAHIHQATWFTNNQALAYASASRDI